MRDNKGRFIKGISYNKGRKLSDNHKKELSKSHSGMHNSIGTEFKKGNVPWHKGKKGLTIAWNKGKHIISNTGKTHFKKGQTAWNKGKKMYKPSWNKGKISKIRKEKHWNWKGGKSLNRNRINTIKWKQIRKKVYSRDNWTCQICSKHCHSDIQCHHIIPYRITQDDSMENLITLCKSCHVKEEIKYYKKLKEVL